MSIGSVKPITEPIFSVSVRVWKTENVLKSFELPITAVTTFSKLKCRINHSETVRKLWIPSLKLSIANV